jgi:hypothetical protein
MIPPTLRLDPTPSRYVAHDARCPKSLAVCSPLAAEGPASQPSERPTLIRFVTACLGAQLGVEREVLTVLVKRAKPCCQMVSPKLPMFNSVSIVN